MSTGKTIFSSPVFQPTLTRRVDCIYTRLPVTETTRSIVGSTHGELMVCQNLEGQFTDNDLINLVVTFPNASIADYASRLGVHPQLILKRLSGIPFKAALAEARADGLYDAAATAESMAVRAVNTIAHIMDNPFAENKDRIAAAKAMIDVGVKLHTVVNTTPQIEMIKAKLQEKSIEIKTKKRERVKSGPTQAIPSHVDEPEQPADSTPPAESVMNRIKDILKNAKGSN